MASLNSRSPSVAKASQEVIWETAEEAGEWIQWMNSMLNIVDPVMVLAIERIRDNKIIGLIGVAIKEDGSREIELLYEIADPYQYQGYATEAARAMIQWAFECCDPEYLVAYVEVSNVASQNVIQKLGYCYFSEKEILYNGKQVRCNYYRLYKEPPQD